MNIGDRVEVMTDIANRYHSSIGIITDADQHAVSQLKEFAVRLADGTETTFSGFQLKVPPTITATRILDEPVSRSLRRMGGRADRHLLFTADEYEVHLKVVSCEKNRELLGQLSSGTTIWQHALVTLLVRDKPHKTMITDKFGEFIFQQVPHGNVDLEFVLPSRRVVATIDA